MYHSAYNGKIKEYKMAFRKRSVRIRLSSLRSTITKAVTSNRTMVSFADGSMLGFDGMLCSCIDT